MSKKVLFVCFANRGRSQVAHAYFDQLSQHDSDSAGIGVDEQIARRNLPNRKLSSDGRGRSIEYIRKAFGVDISERERQQLTPEMVDEADLVIVIAEKNTWPDYLKEGGRIVFWDIPDPYRQDDGLAHDVYRQIQDRVEQLVKEIG